jgi:hypothetical protein
MSLLRLAIVLTILGLTTLLAHDLLTQVGIAGQKQDRVLKKKQWSNEPIKITKLKMKGANVSFGEKQSGDDDWFRGLSIDVKNISNKTIVFIDISIIFPPADGATEEHIASDHMLYGNYPPAPGEPFTSHPDQPSLQPGDSATMVLTDYEGTREFLNQVGKPRTIKEIEISIEDVFFDDGTKFSGGQIWKRDPKNQKIWIPDAGQIVLLRSNPKLIKTAIFMNADFTLPLARPAPTL